MDLFPNGIHVRLRNRVRGTYLHADEDGVGVSLSPRRESLNTAWRVHRAWYEGIRYVLLHGAAYGRYLALSPEPAPPGHRGRRAAQRDYDAPGLRAIMCTAVRVDRGTDDIFLSVFNHNLRANGRYRLWHTGVTADDIYARRSTMMHWVVEVIPPRQEPPELPRPNLNLGGHVGLFFWRTEQSVEPLRTIRYVQANAHGNFDPLGWATFQFFGRSVFLLRCRLAYHLDVPVFGITMCVRAGNNGRMTPLVVDLSSSDEPMDIVVLTNGTSAALQLRHPDVAAP